MANKTIQFMGNGYGETVAIVVKFDGTTVFTGNVPSINSTDVLFQDSEQQMIFTTTVDSAFSGTKPVSIEVTEGSLMVAQVLSNFVPITNPIFSSEQMNVLIPPPGAPATSKQDRINIWTALANPPLSSDEITELETVVDTELDKPLARILQAHNIGYLVNSGETNFLSVNGYSSDSRKNVCINSVAQVIERRAGQDGDFFYMVQPGQTITFDLDIVTADGF